MTNGYSKMHQRRIIRRHYNLTRPVTEAERAAEVANLERKRDADGLDTHSRDLAAKLRVI